MLTLFLAVALGSPIGGFVEGKPDRIYATGESSKIKDESLAREAAATHARANLVLVARALGKLAAPGARIDATLRGSEIVSVECARTCVARAEVPLSGIELRGRSGTLEGAVDKKYADDRAAAFAALDRELKKQRKRR